MWQHRRSCVFLLENQAFPSGLTQTHGQRRKTKEKHVSPDVKTSQSRVFQLTNVAAYEKLYFFNVKSRVFFSINPNSRTQYLCLQRDRSPGSKCTRLVSAGLTESISPPPLSTVNRITIRVGEGGGGGEGARSITRLVCGGCTHAQAATSKQKQTRAG